ncbi:MFS family permease [Thermocatellispora tengchongensis]|uniref:MFS family permease n=1 Tax=Thermocatellispora tengchongensis TaxID=1073253 RepID=A0A840P6Y9_9ACTN|nr:MFS transporter [Thermocatellispora tengchongensis]MBB5135428.1 MFS family permease [Thermocatellispora tengchongensis]
MLGHRPWRLWIAGSLLARLPTSMAGLVLILVGERANGSLAEGAVLAGVLSLCSGPPGPVIGRLLDRLEMRRAMRVTVALSGVVTLGLAVAAEMRAPAWALYALSVLLGLATAGMWGGMRALLVVTVPAAQLRRAHFAESLLVELCSVAGPVLVSVLVVAGGPVAALAGMAALSLLGALLMRAVPPLRPAPVRPAGLLPPRDTQLVSLLVLWVGLAYGLLMANVPQRMAEYGLDSGASGWFTAALPAGACLGGLVVSARPLPRHRALRTTLALLLVSAVLAVPSGLAADALGYAVGLFAAGLLMVPLNGLMATEIEGRMGLRRRAEAFSYFGSASVAGGAGGYFLAGALDGRLDPAGIGLLSSVAFLALALVVGAALVARAGRRSR